MKSCPVQDLGVTPHHSPVQNVPRLGTSGSPLTTKCMPPHRGPRDTPRRCRNPTEGRLNTGDNSHHHGWMSLRWGPQATLHCHSNPEVGCSDVGDRGNTSQCHRDPKVGCPNIGDLVTPHVSSQSRLSHCWGDLGTPETATAIPKQDIPAQETSRHHSLTASPPQQASNPNLPHPNNSPMGTQWGQ